MRWLLWLIGLLSGRPWRLRRKQSINSEGEVQNVSKQPVDQVVFEGTRVIHNILIGGVGGLAEHQGETTLECFVDYLADLLQGRRSRSLGLAPSGMMVRDIHQRGNMFVFLVEVAPGPRTMQWLRDDSLQSFGERATYRDVTVSLPYQYFFVSLSADGCLGRLNSLYFRNEPLRSLNDQLCDCYFYNCSIDVYGAHCWICIEGYQRQKPLNKSPLEFVNEFVEWFWYSGFNRSSEHHEGASFWGRFRQLIADDRVQTIEAWEAATRADPMFALTVPWIDSGYTSWQVYQELTAGAKVWQACSSADLAQLVIKSNKQKKG